MRRRQYVRALGLGGVASLAGCAEQTEEPAARRGSVTLATATTAYDSGLLPVLNRGYADRFGASVEAVVRGTGASLRTARDGDCDVVLVHARPLEDEFIAEGHGINRRRVMVNDFLLVGPPDDPAGAAGSDPLAAFRAIAETEATFLSRGDRSGTHIRELRIWDEAGLSPGGEWYRETGQGMGETLTTARQSGAYTLVDRGTFLAVGDDGVLARHVESGIDDPPPLLRNEYAVIPVNPARHDVAYARAMSYVGYLTGPGQSRIEEFRVDGERAFRRFARSPDPEFEQYVPSDWEG
ncbi:MULTISPECIES: substrate-binding domain-containing protein [Halorubrum]|uniref:Molybdenum transporter n=1 Tax=Halorubrum ezzemoulense TaxID=337243 RepID=A0A256KJ47_HALEZ|nr:MULTISPECIES: substrate-binding domain-containing protein [Halorubrum]OYR76510.1 molybdenum transporter [Halorubrum ezzemoulense]OYR81198.1 molybdenum transporter [Halorubrum ezzemoulense]PHQ43464.1 molybdenum transporter [Halorubrum sp. C191]QAY19414.1 molybdenum transporter [Halorubrum ezzemoulense]